MAHKPELINIEKFMEEIDEHIELLQEIRSKAERAQKKFAKRGKVPLYGMFSWNVAKERIAGVLNSMNRSHKELRKSNA